MLNIQIPEGFKQIDETRYYIDSKGNILSLNKNGQFKILKPNQTNSVTLYVNKKQYCLTIKELTRRVWKLDEWPWNLKRNNE